MAGRRFVEASTGRAVGCSHGGSHRSGFGGEVCRCVCTGTARRAEPLGRVRSGARQLLRRSPAADDGRVYGSRVTAKGKVVGAPIAVSPAESATRPAVVWDGVSFLVVWEGDVARLWSRHSCVPGERRRRVVASRHCHQSVCRRSRCAAVAAGASSSLIAWSNGSGGISDRTFASATGVGAITDLAVTGTDPAVSWNGIAYLAVWSDAGDVLFSVLDPQGVPYGVASLAIADGNTQLEPALASDGSSWLVTWTELTSTYDVMGVLVDADGAVLGSPVPISAGALDQGTSAVGFDGTNFVVVWNDSRNDGSGATYDIFGARVSASTGAVIDTSGVPVSVATGNRVHPRSRGACRSTSRSGRTVAMGCTTCTARGCPRTQRSPTRSASRSSQHRRPRRQPSRWLWTRRPSEPTGGKRQR